MAIVNDLTSGSFNYNVSSPAQTRADELSRLYGFGNNSFFGSAQQYLTSRFDPNFDSRRNEWQAAQAAADSEWSANRNRQFQEYMSNTSYQRAVADLKKAGINPILGLGHSGASTPSGASGSAYLPNKSERKDFFAELLKIVAGLVIHEGASALTGVV